MKTTLTHPSGSVEVVDADGVRTITASPNPGLFCPFRTWRTKYPLELIDHVLRVKGADYLCDEIMRDEDPIRLEHSFRWDILSYVAPEAFQGKRVLDFGSGSGSSSMVMTRLFPGATIVGVELLAEFVALARHRAEYYGVTDRVRFEQSPDPHALPPGLGQFDFVVCSAVFEHLLPAERHQVLPLLWSAVKPGGLMFLDQTPYRWFPIEMHTTNLPFINYLPDSLTMACARRFSERITPDEPWPQLLRKGIRGGTTKEILGILNKGGETASLVVPTRQGVRDEIDLWYQLSNIKRETPAKKLMLKAFRLIKATTGVTMIPTLSLAIRKPA